MKTFNSLEEMKPYYNAETNTYEFDDDVYFKFDLAITANIDAMYINARNIHSWNINADDIRAYNIKALDINAWNINADDIRAWNINADDISFYAVCFATKTFACNSITGRRTNSKYFCLDSEVIIKGETI